MLVLHKISPGFIWLHDQPISFTFLQNYFSDQTLTGRIPVTPMVVVLNSTSTFLTQSYGEVLCFNCLFFLLDFLQLFTPTAVHCALFDMPLMHTWHNSNPVPYPLQYICWRQILTLPLLYTIDCWCDAPPGLLKTKDSLRVRVVANYAQEL